MPSFTGNPFSNFYKRILQINQSGNTAPDSTTRNVQGGDGTATALSLSDDVLGIQPQSDDTTATHYVKKNNGDSIFTVDTTNSLVKVGAGQVSATTQIKQFTAHAMTPVAGNHHPLISNPSTYFASALSEEALGSGTDPDTTYDMSSGSDCHQWVGYIWLLPYAITVDSVQVLCSQASATTDDINFHIMSYAIDTGNGGTSGDLSSGTVVADGSAVTVDRTLIGYQSMTIQAANISAGRAIIATIESDGTATTSANMQ